MNRHSSLIYAAGWCLVLVLFLQQLPVFAQDAVASDAPVLEPVLHFSHLTSDDGLVQNMVEAILQDRQGFLWIGTPSGLSRYDGYRFITYRNEPDNPNSLSHNWIRDLYEDADGMIWIATEGGGVNKYNPSTGSFTRYMSELDNPNSLPGNRVFHIFQDSTDNFWFVGAGLTGVNKFNPTTETFTRYPTAPAESPLYLGGNTRDIQEDEAGYVWFASSNMLAKYDSKTDEFTYYTPPERDGRKEDRLGVIRTGDAGTLWIGGILGLYRFDTASGTFTLVPGIADVRDMLADEVGNFWIATGRGLYRFDPHAGQILTGYRHDALRLDSLSDDSVTELYRDREGIVWLGTNEGGLNYFDPRQLRFAHYRHDTRSEASLALDTVDALAASDGSRLWVGTGSILNHVDLNSGEVKHYPLTDDSGAPRPIKAVYQDTHDMVWLGLNSLQVLRFNPETEAFTEFNLESQARGTTPPKSIIDFYENGDGTLWIAVNHDGLYRLDIAQETFEYYETPSPAPPEAYGNGAVEPARTGIRAPINDVYADRQGYLWVATLNGVHRLDVRTGTFQSYRARPGGQGADSFMESVLEDHTGIIWLASRDGLIRLDPQTGETIYYTEKDGLPSISVLGILEDSTGNLWISTRKGLSKFNPLTGQFRNYDASDGLQGNEFSQQAFAQLPDDQMAFGGIHGLTVFDPVSIQDNPYQPGISLTDFLLSNKPVTPGSASVLARPITATDSLTLTHEQNILSFEFAALSYAAPHKNRYRYRLDGFETEWNETDSTRRFVTYTNLPSGSYVFRVQGSNNDGTWSNQEVTLDLNMLPPWWETPWFRAVLVVALIGLILAGYQWRVYAMARRNRELEREVARQTSALQERTVALETRESQLRHAKEAAEAANRAKSAFLASMSHELRSPLNAILGFAQVTDRTPSVSREVRENLGIILRSGEHLLELINQVLDLSKIEAGQMLLNETDFDLHRLLYDLEEMFLLRADDKYLKLNFEMSPDLPRYLHTDAVKLRQVLINLLGNALKFTEEGSVTVRARRGSPALNQVDAPPELLFEVEDTGPGIPAGELALLFQAFTQTSSGRRSQEGTGLGLTISRKFVELMGGTMSVRSEAGQGATFSFSIQRREIAAIATPELTAGRRIVGLAPNQPTCRMLVVDDKWMNRQLLVKLFSPLGFDIREAENGRVAVDIARTFQPHLIWMDMRMPEMDGIAATREIRTAPHGKDMAIIALTASAYDEERQAVLLAGCDDFLRKPFRAEDLFEIVRKYLGVQYLYEPAARITQPVPSLNDVKAAVQTLSPDLRLRLIESTELGDVEMIEKSLVEIRRKNAALGDSLSRLAHRFEYDRLLDVLKDAVL